MRKILTLFTALAVALVFAFLSSASPPTFAAEKPKFEQAFFQTDCGEDAGIDIEFNFAAVCFEQDSEEIAAYSFAAQRNHALRAGAGIKYKNSVGLAYNPKIEFNETATYYKPPSTRIFNGFDYPARGKI